MATIGTLIERLFQNTYAAVSLPPPGTPTRAFSLVLPFSPSRPLSLAPSRYRSSSLSSRTFSLFQPPFSSRSLIRVRPMPYPLGLLSRSSLLSRLSIPVRIGASSAPLSRRCSSFEASLSAAVHNHPPAARSVLVEFAARSPLRHRAHLRILLARALHPFRRSVPVSIRSETLLSIFLSSSLPHLASLFPRPLFRSPRCFLSPTNAFSPDVYVSSGVWYAGRTSYKRAGAYVCTQAVLLALVSRAAGRRACSNRFDTRSWGKKNGRMYRRRLSPRRVNTPRPRVRARATRALGQWRNFSRFFLLPFCIGPAFRIYLRVIRFAAGYNMRRASRRMDAAGVR